MKLNLTNWNISRILFLLLGTVIIIQAIQTKEWLGFVIGPYFLLMGIFSLGCAGGNCIPQQFNHKGETESEIQFEEVQMKEKN